MLFFRCPKTFNQTDRLHMLSLEIHKLLKASKLLDRCSHYVQQSASPCSILARWQLALSEYDLDVFHVLAKDITIADGLSRLEEDAP